MDDAEAVEYEAALRQMLIQTGFGWIVEQVDQPVEDAPSEEFKDEISLPRERLRALVDATETAIRDRRDAEIAMLVGFDAKTIRFDRDSAFWSGTDAPLGLEIHRASAEQEEHFSVLMAALTKLRHALDAD
jgi:hypothetical protein